LRFVFVAKKKASIARPQKQDLVARGITIDDTSADTSVVVKKLALEKTKKRDILTNLLRSKKPKDQQRRNSQSEKKETQAKRASRTKSANL
jgi:hypothetical protein